MTDEMENQMIQAAWRIYRKYKGEYHRTEFWRCAADDIFSFLQAYSGYWENNEVHDFAYNLIYAIFRELKRQYEGMMELKEQRKR